MPKVFPEAINGLIFFFFSREHLPIQVHVENADGLIKIQIEPEVKVIFAQGMKPKQIRMALKIAEERKSEIIAKWYEHFRV